MRMQGTSKFRGLKFDVRMGQHHYEGQTVHSEKAQSLLCLLDFFFSAEDQIQRLTSCYTNALPQRYTSSLFDTGSCYIACP